MLALQLPSNWGFVFLPRPLLGKSRIQFSVHEERQAAIVMLLGKDAATVYLSPERSSPLIMKVIPLSEAKARLSYYSRLCHREPVIVTVKGVPAFQLAPLEEDDDLIGRLLEYNPKFRTYLQSCLRGRSLTSEEALDRLK